MDEKFVRFLKKHMSASLVIKILRFIMMLRPSLARRLINGMTQPLRSQKKYIRMIQNKHWEGALIMPNVSTCDDETAIKRLQNADIVIFNIHGGAFRAGHCTMYMDSFISWIDIMKQKHNLNACIMSVEYGLAPEHVYPGPLLQCIKAYKHLVQDLNIPPSKIILSGDSAGGCHAMELLIRTYAPPLLNNLNAKRSNKEIGLPAGLLLVSPLVSGVDTSLSWHQYHHSDIVSRTLRFYVYDEYLVSSKSTLEELEILRLHTVTKGFDRFLPKNVMVFVGTIEAMRDDILDLTGNIEKDGTCNVTVVQEEFLHDWFMIHDIVGHKNMYIIDKYNEQFVDFAVHAVNTYKDEHIKMAPADVKETETTKPEYIEYTFTPAAQKRKPSSRSFSIVSLFNIFKRRKLPFISDYIFGSTCSIE